MLKLTMDILKMNKLCDVASVSIGLVTMIVLYEIFYNFI